MTSPAHLLAWALPPWLPHPMLLLAALHALLAEFGNYSNQASQMYVQSNERNVPAPPISTMTTHTFNLFCRLVNHVLICWLVYPSLVHSSWHVVWFGVLPLLESNIAINSSSAAPSNFVCDHIVLGCHPVVVWCLHKLVVCFWKVCSCVYL